MPVGATSSGPRAGSAADVSRLLGLPDRGPAARARRARHLRRAGPGGVARDRRDARRRHGPARRRSGRARPRAGRARTAARRSPATSSDTKAATPACCSSATSPPTRCTASAPRATPAPARTPSAARSASATAPRSRAGRSSSTATSSSSVATATYMLGGTYLVVRDIHVNPSWHGRAIRSSHRPRQAHRRAAARPAPVREARPGRSCRRDSHIRQASPRTSGVTILRRGYDTPEGLLLLAFMQDPRRQFVPLQTAPRRARRPAPPHDHPRQRRVRHSGKPIVVRSMIVSSLHVTHFSDPGCPWAWSASPALAALKWRYGDQLDWRNVMIGLTENGSVYEQRGYTGPGQARGYRTLPRARDAVRDRAAREGPRHVADVPRGRRHPPARPRARVRGLPRAAVRPVHDTAAFLEDAEQLRTGDRVGARHRRRQDHGRRPRTRRPRRPSSATATRPAPRPTRPRSSRTSTPTPTAACATRRRA